LAGNTKQRCFATICICRVSNCSLFSVSIMFSSLWSTIPAKPALALALPAPLSETGIALQAAHAAGATADKAIADTIAALLTDDFDAQALRNELELTTKAFVAAVDVVSEASQSYHSLAPLTHIATTSTKHNRAIACVAGNTVTHRRRVYFMAEQNSV
jgi:hypothetical protein